MAKSEWGRLDAEFTKMDVRIEIQDQIGQFFKLILLLEYCLDLLCDFSLKYWMQSSWLNYGTHDLRLFILLFPFLDVGVEKMDVW